MGALLSGGDVVQVPPPPSQKTGVAAAMEQGPAPVAERRPLRADSGVRPGETGAMSDTLGYRGKPEEPTRRAPNPKHQGGSMLEMLQPDLAKGVEAGEVDPFAHARGGAARKGPTPNPPRSLLAAVGGDNFSIAGLSLGGTAPAAGAAPAAPVAEDPLHAQLVAVHAELLALVKGAARGAEGELLDYQPLLALLASHGIRLDPNAAGTLIATCDVQGGITFDEFMECLAHGFAEPEAAPPPAAHAPPAVSPVRVPRAPGQAGSPAFEPLVGSAAQGDHGRADVKAMLEGKSVSHGASSMIEVSRLLNGSPSAHARQAAAKSDLRPTQVRGLQFR